MVPTVWVVLSALFTLVTQINGASFCTTSEGDPGKCLQPHFCPSSTSQCGDGSVCCPMLQRIVTPNATPRPVVPPVPFPTSPPIVPPITILPVPIPTPAPVSTGGAAGKCEEYKHIVNKRSTIMTYVFGGTASAGKEFPHMAILGYGRPEKVEWLCGGSLISEQFVVTAAHCLITSNLGDLIRVRLGELDLQSVSDDANPQDFAIAQRYVHPQYRPPSQYNDIALLRLERPVQFSDYIAPICVEVNRNLPNTDFIATGWGRTELGGSQSDILMKVDLEYFPNDACQRNYQDVAAESLSRGIIDESQICAGSYQEEKDTCQGDSGGPLQIRDDVLYLVGITSFGKACGVANSPAVYTRVSYYVPWIEQIVWPQ